MKKTILILALISFVMTAAFANPNVVTTSGSASNVGIKVEIGEKASAAWMASKYEKPNVYTDLISTAADEYVFSSAHLHWEIYATVLTNRSTQASVTIGATPLLRENGSDTIAYSVNGTTITNVANNNIAVYKTPDNSTGLRCFSEQVSIRTTDEALNAATAGTYRATLSMTVTSL